MKSKFMLLKSKFLNILYLILFGASSYASVYINEILFNPPGIDSPNEYIELRGTPNYILPNGTYLIGIEGDTNGNPGVIQNIFDLSGVPVGGNGFIVLLQKSSQYSVVEGSTVLINSGSGSGWGNNSSGSIKHQGENGQTEIENPSVTFMLIYSTNKPSIGIDIDIDNDGIPENDVFGQWTVWDSIGILDSSGAGDIGYGWINYRANSSALVKTGRAIEINFTPSYIGRLGNTTNCTENDWVVSDNLGGAVPIWILGPPASTLPTGFAMSPLNNIGGPNFNAPLIPGVILSYPSNLNLQESGGTNCYFLRLNTQPFGQVVVQIITDGQTLISTNKGTNFVYGGFITFTNTNSVQVFVKAIDDNIVEPSVHKSVIQHSIVQTFDNFNYPTSSILPAITFDVFDNDFLLLNEIKVNPPGEDSPFEYIEILGVQNAVLTNVYLLVLNGDGKKNPGNLELMISLNGFKLGKNGLLFLCASNSQYVPDSETTIMVIPEFSHPGGVLPNNAISFMLISTESPPVQGKDLDDDNNGTLEDLAKNTWVLDAIGWTSGRTNDIVYGGAVISFEGGTPDAVVRIPGNFFAVNSSSWFCGQLFPDSGSTIEFDPNHVSSNFPPGANLTPGRLNDSYLIISSIAPLSGVIGDQTNPEVYFSVSNVIASSNFSISVSANNQSVIPNSHLTIEKISGLNYKLKIEPAGVGYSTITITASDGYRYGVRSFYYAASEPGRPGGYFLTGVSDASAAIAIDQDWMFVGDDENETIRIYPRNRSGSPVAEFNMTPYLGLIDFEGEKPREVDIEAAYRIGNRIYWVGAHSNSNIGEGRTNRARIFVTDIVGSGTNSSLVYVGRYDYLKDDLVNWDINNGHGKGAGYYNLAYSAQDGIDPKTPWGFNIEGVVPAPDNPQAALIALRAPLVPPTNRVYALIVPVLNFTTIATSGAPAGSAVFGNPVELDLFNRGIRDIVGNSNGYIIIAGTPYNLPGPYPNDFKLFLWSGYSDSSPREMSADLSGLIPEGIVELPPQPWTENTEIQVVSDCGTRVYYNDGIPAKLLPVPNFKKFRVDKIKLGTVVKSAPIIKNINRENGSITLRWRSISNDLYSLQYKISLSDSNWITIPGVIKAIGTWSSYTDGEVNLPEKYYRILVYP